MASGSYFSQVQFMLRRDLVKNKHESIPIFVQIRLADCKKHKVQKARLTLVASRLIRQRTFWPKRRHALGSTHQTSSSSLTRLTIVEGQKSGLIDVVFDVRGLSVKLGHGRDLPVGPVDPQPVGGI